MILRKPYAFLIKYFRLIHIMMFVLFVYLIFSIRPIYLFFSDYVNGNSYMYFDGIAGKYVPILLLIVVLIIMALAISIFFLMRKKEKPVLFYKLVIVYTIILFISLIYFYFFFASLYNTNYSPLRIVINRDVALIIYLINFLYVGFSFIRAFGFDIKKFSFEKDRKELKLEEEDNEEYEVNVNIEKEDITNYLNRQKKEFKYYFMENSRFFIIVSIIIVVSLLLYFGYSYFVVNKIYKQKQSVNIGNMSYTVNKTLVTSIDKYGRETNNDYLIVYLNIKNNGMKTTLDKQQFRINIDDDYYYASASCNLFSDLGECLYDYDIGSNSEKEYILAYKLEKNNKKIYFEILKNKNTYQYSRVSLSKNKENREIINYKKGDSFSINGIDLKVDDYSFFDKTSYVYQECNSNKCINYTKVVNPKLGDKVLELKIFNSNKLSNDFLNNYLGLQYRNKTLYGDDIDILARNNDSIYLGITRAIHDEDKLVLIINSRNNEYDILLKEGKNE